MLWFDNDKSTSLKQKIYTAMDYYQKKYGQVATTCHIHPSMMTKENFPLKVKKDFMILKNHFWLGVEEG